LLLLLLLLQPVYLLHHLCQCYCQPGIVCCHGQHQLLLLQLLIGAA
jgi:hypothetical protein